MGVENISSCNVDTLNKITEINTRKTAESSCKIGCDLSLRSGPLFVTPMSVGNSKPQEVEDIGFGSSRVGCKHSDQSPVDRKFAFINGGNAYGPCSNEWSFEDKCINVEETTKKRKAVLNHCAEDQQFYRQPKLPCSHLTGGMRNAGFVDLTLAKVCCFRSWCGKIYLAILTRFRY